MRQTCRRVLPFLLLVAAGCGAAQRAQLTTTGGALQLSRVVLYRNGVGYFERHGRVDGDVLTLRVRKDQVNDLLKSLTVVERHGGRAVSISMPCQPKAPSPVKTTTCLSGLAALAAMP